MSTTTARPAWCAFCAMHNHGNCHGCACADTGHRPGADLAAEMRSYERPDTNSQPIEVRASAWHRKEAQR